MARNATESDFRTSKMAAGSHFVKNFTKIKIVVLIWNGKKCDTKWFLATFTKKIARVIWTMFEPIAGRLQLDINSLLVNIYIYTYRQLCWERGNIHCVRHLGRMHTILVIIELINLPHCIWIIQVHCGECHFFSDDPRTDYLVVVFGFLTLSEQVL